MPVSIKQILIDHAQTYPLMQPQDAVKLLYQNEFGPGHLISDPEFALQRLRGEYACVNHEPNAALCEDIGSGLVRVHLNAVSTDSFPLEQLNESFVRSAHLHTGSQTSFLQKLNILRELADQNVFSFSSKELEPYLTSYIAAGCPAVSHSQLFRDAYQPAYRVVSRTCLPPLPVILDALRQHPIPHHRPLLVAIDGRCASGKTTLAAQLQKALGCCAVHMDDFFLRPEQRSETRCSTPGENVDHERFLEEVLLPLSLNEVSQYRSFDCSTQQLRQPIPLNPTSIVIVEGSYSCHPNLWPYYDLRVFLTISPEQQMERILTREGTEYAQVFRHKWIPLEEAYFAAFDLNARCDLCFEG